MWQTEMSIAGSATATNDAVVVLVPGGFTKSR